MSTNPHKPDFDPAPLAGQYMARPRVDKLFAHAAKGKLVYVVAGAGYGKTQAVHHYIEGQKQAVVRWMQLTESDNVGSRYWESLTHIIAADNPELAAGLRELGFPETPARFKQFAAIVKNTEHPSRKTFLVLDDFHLIHSEEALTFAQRCAHLSIPGACVIILSRTEPEINTLSLFSAGKASRITEQELCFTEEEIADFFKQSGVPFAAKDLPRFADVTKGWALAVKLLALVLKRNPAHPDRAIDTMKQNVFKLLETEAWDGLPQSVQKTIVRLSLVSDLPLAPLNKILDGGPLLHSAPALTSFVWLDSLTGNYRIHPLYLEFVQTKRDVLSYEEQQDTYRNAGQWCHDNGFSMDAVQYYVKSHQLERVIETLFSYPFKLPADACTYFLGILEDINPDSKEQDDPHALLLKHFFIPLLLMGAGRAEEARERSFTTVREWEHAGTPFSLFLLGIAYSNLSYFDLYTCTMTHRYDAAGHLKKSVEYFKKSGIPLTGRSGAFGVPDIRSYACLVGEGATLEEFDIFLQAARDTAVYVEETFHDMYYGYDDLVACEIAFFKNHMDEARNHAHKAVLKAREKKQYSIESVAQEYLLRMAVHEGDYPLVKEMLAQLGAHLDNPDFWNRQRFYDLHTALFYAQIGLPGRIPAWFVPDEKETSEVHIPARELLVGAKYYIASKKYNQALAILSGSTPREPQERFLFGELAFSLLTAVAKIKIGDAAGAVADFKKAYYMSFEGVFETSFIETGRNLRPLVTAAIEDGALPEERLKTIDRKASVYAKKTDVILNAIKREEKIEETIALSEREREVLLDLYHGLSREEIAANQYLSVNTVKKLLQSVYIKLDANNNVDAVRIALEKKLIE